VSIPRDYYLDGRNIDRAKRMQEVIIALLTEGAPDTFWVASRLRDGRTQGAAYPSKKSAMEHTVDPNEFMFMHIVAADGFPTVEELMVNLWFNEQREAYWRTREDLQLHIPKSPVQDLGAYSGNRPDIPRLIIED
jgi:hypothetical protein